MNRPSADLRLTFGPWPTLLPQAFQLFNCCVGESEAEFYGATFDPFALNSDNIRIPGERKYKIKAAFDV